MEHSNISSEEEDAVDNVSRSVRRSSHQSVGSLDFGGLGRRKTAPSISLRSSSEDGIVIPPKKAEPNRFFHRLRRERRPRSSSDITTKDENNKFKQLRRRSKLFNLDENEEHKEKPKGIQQFKELSSSIFTSKESFFDKITRKSSRSRSQSPSVGDGETSRENDILEFCHHYSEANLTSYQHLTFSRRISIEKDLAKHSQTHSMKEVMHDPIGFKAYLKYLSRAKAEESLIYWNAVELMKLFIGTADNTFHEIADCVMNLFILDDCEYPLNVSGHSRNALTESWYEYGSQCPLDLIRLFENVQLEAFNVLLQDKFLTFSRSEMFPDHLKRHSSEVHLRRKSSDIAADFKLL